MRLVAWGLGMVLAGAAQARQPAFELLPLGTYGGGYEGNLTCFALREVGAPRFRLLIDGGSMAEGVLRWQGKAPDGRGGVRDIAPVERFFLGLDDVLFTHAHLDHLSGWVIQSPLLFGRQGPPVRIHGTAHTIEGLRRNLFDGTVWVDLEAAGKVELHAPPAAEAFAAGGFTVRAFPLSHTIPAYGYAIETAAGDAYVHLGDTGPTEGDHREVRDLLRRGRLRALSLECSFESGKEGLARTTGHLTPDLLVAHLRELVDPWTGAGPRPPLGDQELRRLAAALAGVRLLVQHIKPGDERAIRQQLGSYRRRGLPLLIPRQGQSLYF